MTKKKDNTNFDELKMKKKLEDYYIKKMEENAKAWEEVRQNIIKRMEDKNV